MLNILSLLPVVGDILDKVIPDKNAAQKARTELELLAQTGKLQVQLSQLAINAKEAEHPSIFVSGWRPAVGWTCVAALVWHYVVLPIILFMLSIFDIVIPVPAFDTAALMTLLGSLLGVGVVRTVEKIKGVARKN